MKNRTRMRLGDVTVVDCGQPRQKARSVSWNSTGSWLAGAVYDRSEWLAKIWTVEGGSQGRELLNVSGHSGAVDRVRFHPAESSLLCTAAQDRSVRIWDVRSASQRSIGRIDLISSSRFGNSASSIEWARNSSLLAVTEKDNTVQIYDVRKLSFSVKGGRASSAEPLHSFALKLNRVESCIFSPSGKYLVATTTFQGEGMGELRVWPWEEKVSLEQHVVYPAHTGPIYSHAFSPDGKRLVTGGSDAIVGLWDVGSMVCTHAISRRTKFIRSVDFSHDSKLVASSSEEDGIDLADASNGDFVGKVGRGGADEVAFHPKAPLLAWARGDVMGAPPPVAVARLDISHQ